jgi:formiminoglutamase
LEQELNRVRDIHGFAVLYDCHSIRSEIPFLFEGTLPDFNIGTNGGTTCGSEIEDAVVNVCKQAFEHTSVLNGRFKGGWTTRHYGRPSENIHAIQMELAQSTHLKSEVLPFDYDPAKAKLLRVHLKKIMQALADLTPQLGASS